MTVIKAENLSLSYDKNKVVTNLDFEIEQGAYLCIVGENGSGKSTLVKAIMGLKKPSGGKLFVHEHAKAPFAGYLPQQTEAQKDFPASVYEVVISGCLGGKGLFGFYSKADKAKAEDCMKKTGVYDLKNKCYRNLSGGQQQRVLLARALCSAKNMLLLDEPASALDPVSSEEMYKTVKRLNEENGMTVVMVSHDIEAAVKYSSHILHLDNTALFFGKTGDYGAKGNFSAGENHA